MASLAFEWAFGVEPSIDTRGINTPAASGVPTGRDMVEQHVQRVGPQTPSGPRQVEMFGGRYRGAASTHRPGQHPSEQLRPRRR
jgi:hypothetical protein